MPNRKWTVVQCPPRLTKEDEGRVRPFIFSDESGQLHSVQVEITQVSRVVDDFDHSHYFTCRGGIPGHGWVHLAGRLKPGRSSPCGFVEPL